VAYERKGKLYVRNEGNTPVSYSLSITAGQPSRCNGMSSVDFQYSNGPAMADGGLPASFMVPSFKLPMSVMAPMPWETAPVVVTYRPRSACRGGDDSDLSTVAWTRQGEPSGSMRRPTSMLATLTGASLLSQPVPNPVSFTGNRPVPQDVSLISNTGDGPVQLLGVELWQSQDGGTTPTQSCAAATTGPCLYYAWVQPPHFPVLLEGTTVPGARVNTVVGRLAFGVADDGGVYVAPALEQRVFAVVQTSDPYSPSVTVPITGRGQ
jgi:hypothetical protein